jgi:hypothetical protein
LRRQHDGRQLSQCHCQFVRDRRAKLRGQHEDTAIVGNFIGVAADGDGFLVR